MGNSSIKITFDMSIYFIGDNIKEFHQLMEEIKQDKKKLESNWTFECYYDSQTEYKEQIEKYYSFLLQIKESENVDPQKLKQVLIIEVKNNSDEEKILYLIKKLNEIENISYNPFILFLFDNYDYSTSNESLNIEWETYPFIDPRTIFIGPFITKRTENYYQIYESKIQKILFRFCSIHNELGDRFTIGEKNKKEDIDLIEKYFPFNINIACIGRFRQGKSTGVNVILNSYKAKEGDFGTTQTKKINFYQVNNKPVRVLDIPGFENEKTVNDAIEQFKKCGEIINKIKDNIHIILYFLNYRSLDFLKIIINLKKKLVNYLKK